MSQADVDVVLKQYRDTNARDFAAVMDAYADDVELVAHGERFGLLGGRVTGKHAVGEWFGDWFRQFDRGYRFEVEEARDVGGRVLLVATHHGRGRDSGVPVGERWAYAYTLRDEKVVAVEIWADREARATALKALGSQDQVDRA
ncbi:MAG: nuclear transport factor 2 family protein [Thermoleophilaceae bacterium]|nr:nuclear transport factor 2 family protein [Thermoleophilaceae bacterium]